MRLLAPLSAALLAAANLAAADGSYNVSDFDGNYLGTLQFTEVLGTETVWDWSGADGAVTLFIENPRGGRGDWSNGTYFGYYVTFLDHGVHPTCRNNITDSFGNPNRAWGEVTMTWDGRSDDFFYLDGIECGDMGSWSAQASFDYGGQAPQPPNNNYGNNSGGGYNGNSGGGYNGNSGGTRGCTTHTLTAEAQGNNSHFHAENLAFDLLDETLRNEQGVLQSSEGPHCIYTHQGNNDVKCEIIAVMCY